MGEAALAIPNLLYRYADAIDAGRLDDAAALFDDGAIVVGERTLRGRDAIVAFWRGCIRLYDDGTPRTRHLVTNPRIELDADGLHARCTSQWTVLQQVQRGTAPVLLASGRYDDRLACRDGRWRFTERRYAGIDMAGDLGSHLLWPGAPARS